MSEQTRLQQTGPIFATSQWIKGTIGLGANQDVTVGNILMPEPNKAVRSTGGATTTATSLLGVCIALESAKGTGTPGAVKCDVALPPSIVRAKVTGGAALRPGQRLKVKHTSNLDDGFEPATAGNIAAGLDCATFIRWDTSDLDTDYKGSFGWMRGIVQLG